MWKAICDFYSMNLAPRFRCLHQDEKYRIEFIIGWRTILHTGFWFNRFND